jgi:DNA-binding CsgD family transcriptional regulator
MATGQAAQDSTAAGREALARGDWSAAHALFEEALAREESAEAWDGLSWAAWWLADADTTLRAREAAYLAYRARGEAGAAARIAAWLAADYVEFRGEEAPAFGWLARAKRLIEDAPDGPDHGWVTVLEGDLAMKTGDFEQAARLAGGAAELGRRYGVHDLEAVGLAMEGMARVAQGEVEEGMRGLDEASAIAAAEQLELPISMAWAFCYMVSACEGVGDFPRATQWCTAMRGFTERWGGRQILGICRSAYGSVLATGGDWDNAERELVAAVDDLVAARPGMAGGGLVRLGQLRARQDRPGEARELFERAGSHHLALVGLGELALDAGDAAEARDAAERVLRRAPRGALLDRLPALELGVRARAALGDLDSAAADAAELERTAMTLGTPYLRGRGHLATAELELARGDHDAARRAAEDALDCFNQGAAPYEAALARLALAGALRGCGRPEPAEREARAARELFASLGAERDVRAADELLAAADSPPTDGARSLGDLTARELEVLRLVAQGLSDAEIAERLVLSPHTVHRHVANVRTKLRLPSRAAAVAYATRSGLI